jgi:ubiquinone/menaquinone biosynthesis C-methylase UbiE
VLPIGDHTSANFALPVTDRIEHAKRLVRRFVYPIYNAVNHISLERSFATDDFRPDLWLWGQRGNDYERHRRRVGSYLPIQGRDVLVAGCGTGKDIESWLVLKPRRILGIDWFSYARAWTLWRERYVERGVKARVDFAQADLAHLSEISDSSFDLVGSDAVFEHLRNLPEVLSEFYRILRPGGIVYATFGPLWYAYGGDHVSGYDAVTSGYNHLTLHGDAYREYLRGLGPHTHSEHDGRTWIEHDLFSRLGPRQYLKLLAEAGFRRLFVSAIIDPLAVACLAHPAFDKTLLARFDILDLHVSGLTIIYGK